MTVYGAFDLEDDDFFNDVFDNISEVEVSTIQAASTLSPDNSVISASKPLSQEVSFQTSEKKSETLSVLDTQFSNSHGTNVKTSIGNPIIDSPNSFEKHENFEMQKIFIPNLNHNIDKTIMINSRFTPGFTPKAKKRKIPGPVGLFSQLKDDPFSYNEFDSPYKKSDGANIDIQDITNSQFSADDLLLPSWQNLQVDVSSSNNLSSTAKYYSIRRVFHETSKKKLPKHIVVPVLCVLLKKFNHMESPSLFIDDTGEITGKIDKEVLQLYEAYLKDGISLILKKVTCICNVLLLTKQSLASIYLEDGTAKHIQEIDSVSFKETPLKPMTCECTETTSKPMRKKCALENSCVSPAVSRNYIYKHKNFSSNSSIKVSCSKESTSNSFKPRTPNNNSYKFSNSAKQMAVHNSKSAPNVLGIGQNMVSSKYLDNSSSLKSNPEITNNWRSTLSNNESRCDNKLQKTVCENSTFNASDTNHSTLNYLEQKCPWVKTEETFSKVETSEGNDFFGGNSEMDEFDELLGSLDEKSFLEEI